MDFTNTNQTINIDDNKKKYCIHAYQIIGNKEICSKCGKKRLALTKVDEDISFGMRDDGKKYTVRFDRNAYFMPDEWILFYDSLRKDNQLLFEFLICTGARIEEALLFKTQDLIDEKRNTIKLYITKKKAKKQQDRGAPRSFEISEKLFKKLAKQKDGFIFINAPPDMERTDENRAFLRKFVNSVKVSNYKVMRNHLKKLCIQNQENKDFQLLWNNMAFHNIRKTHGMWLKSLRIEMTEICLRLGHDIETYRKHYGSPSRFNKIDKIKMLNIIGNIYELNKEKVMYS